MRGRPIERRALRRGFALLDAGAEAASGPFVEGAVADHHLGDPGGDGEGGLLDGGAGGAAAVVDAGEEGEVSHAGRLGDGDRDQDQQQDGERDQQPERALVLGEAERTRLEHHRA